MGGNKILTKEDLNTLDTGFFELFFKNFILLFVFLKKLLN
jgi:hypothetical protein